MGVLLQESDFPVVVAKGRDIAIIGTIEKFLTKTILARYWTLVLYHRD